MSIKEEVKKLCLKKNILIINKKTMKKTDFSYELTKEDFVKFNMYHMDKQYRKYHFRMISFIL